MGNTEHWNCSDYYEVWKVMKKLISIFVLACIIGINHAFATAATGGIVTNYTDVGGTNWTAHIFTNTGSSSIVFSQTGMVEYLIIAGGGGGGGGSGTTYGGGGGGAGGYRCSVRGETSGANSTAESRYNVTGTTYTIIVATGGVGGASTKVGGNGGTSAVFGVVSIGGGGGSGSSDGANGGSGGGGGRSIVNGQPGLGTANQGSDGGNGGILDGNAGGGGSARAVGGSGDIGGGGNGASGLTSLITGIGVARAGGGGGGGKAGGGSGRSGGGDGASPGSNAVVNTGSGGGGCNNGTGTGGRGGSGIVVIRYITVETTTTPIEWTLYEPNIILPKNLAIKKPF